MTGEKHNPRAVYLSQRDYPALRRSSARTWISSAHGIGPGERIPLALPVDDPGVEVDTRGY